MAVHDNALLHERLWRRIGPAFAEHLARLKEAGEWDELLFYKAATLPNREWFVAFAALAEQPRTDAIMAEADDMIMASGVTFAALYAAFDEIFDHPALPPDEKKAMSDVVKLLRDEGDIRLGGGDSDDDHF